MFSVDHIIATGGLLLVAAMIFAESGLFVGFFFPGDTLLLSAGIFAAEGKYLHLDTLLPVIAIAAIAGDNIGYWIGKRYGRELFDRPNSVIFKHKYIEEAERFFAKYGTKAMALAHFVPVVRTFAPAAAGIAEMDYKKFVFFDAVGDIAWAVIVTLIGYYFGSKIPNIDRYIMFVVGIVVLAVLAPAVYHFIKAKREIKREQNQAKK